MQSSVQKHPDEVTAFRHFRGHYRRGELLSIEETDRCLTLEEETKKFGRTMKENIGSVRGDLSLSLQIDFPVMKLQHVTNWESLEKILESNSFKSKSDHERPDFRDLSFWSADVCPDDIESARQQAYDKVRHVRNAERFQTEIKEQYASSPTFEKSASRFGNFRFSFPLSYLLSLYKTQHCGGEAPQLRILGTDIYKREIAHYIVVHSPKTDQFNDLPIVPTAQNNSGPSPFVYWMEETLFWRPESTSKSLKLKISEEDCQVRWSDPPSSSRRPECTSKSLKPKISEEDCQVRRSDPPSGSRRLEFWHKKRAYEPRCVWNGLVFAFHLPGNGQLQLSTSQLLSNLTPCDVLQPSLGQAPMQKHEAKEKIRRLREESNGVGLSQ